MDPASAPYRIWINGHLGATLLSAFPAMAAEHRGTVTVLTGVLDRSGLHGVLAAIDALGLDLVEVRQLAPEREPGRPQRHVLGPATVSRIGFGAMQLPGPGVFGPPRDRDEAIAVLRRAAELGVDHIDTAQFYGPDVATCRSSRSARGSQAAIRYWPARR